MKHWLLSLLVLISFSTLGQSTQEYKVKIKTKTTQAATGSKVYICDSNSAYAYHSSNNCSGLNRCSHTILALSQSGAEGKGRRPCKKCY